MVVIYLIFVFQNEDEDEEDEEAEDKENKSESSSSASSSEVSSDSDSEWGVAGAVQAHRLPQTLWTEPWGRALGLQCNPPATRGSTFHCTTTSIRISPTPSFALALHPLPYPPLQSALAELSWWVYWGLRGFLNSPWVTHICNCSRG